MAGSGGEDDGRKRVLLVASNPAVSDQTGWPIGFWWAELVHPYWAFAEVGYDIVIASPDGGSLQADAYSDPEDESGYSAHDFLSLGFKHSPRHAQLLEDTPALGDLDVSTFDGVLFIGGQGPMYTFMGSAVIAETLRTFYESGKPTAVICHATCALLEATDSSGELIVAGKTWTGFANSEEQYADQAAGQQIQPFRIEDRAAAMESTNFIVNKPFASFAVQDGNLITGQQQNSGTAAAELVIRALGV
ncbi:type 1 glutamine amidotransferase domain-containing protein [Euzebya tangerina]|uniref:type 1 glutamine amidotransferase domain-containing protein n=1 Tax=Euzebya tangerina TaxID=591198 RepID=UPI000E313973|nr:type 1 glutamine amidotransferase domain-containing protein [Euzebya tangerina]